MNQKQHDTLEFIIANNKDSYLVEHHEKHWGVIVDIRERRRDTDRYRTAGIYWIDKEGVVQTVAPNG